MNPPTSQRCSKCLSYAPVNATVCPKCGGPFVAPVVHQEPKPKGQLSNKAFYGILIGAFLCIGVFMSWRSDPRNGQVKYSNAPAASRVTAAFDVPSLVGKDMNGVKAALGTPSEDDSNMSLPNGDDKHLVQWKREKVTLMVEYHKNTGKVVDFFVATDDPSGGSGDKTRTLALGNLDGTAPHYAIEFVENKMTGKHTGVKAIPLG